MRQEFFLFFPIETIIHERQNDYYKALHNVIIDDIIIGVIEGYLPVALWFQKVIKSKKMLQVVHWIICIFSRINYHGSFC